MNREAACLARKFLRDTQGALQDEPGYWIDIIAVELASQAIGFKGELPLRQRRGPAPLVPPVVSFAPFLTEPLKVGQGFTGPSGECHQIVSSFVARQSCGRHLLTCSISEHVARQSLSNSSRRYR